MQTTGEVTGELLEGEKSGKSEGESGGISVEVEVLAKFSALRLGGKSEGFQAMLYLAGINKVMASMAHEHYYSADELVEIHWTIYGDYGKFINATTTEMGFGAGIRRYDYLLNRAYLQNLFEDHHIVTQCWLKRQTRTFDVMADMSYVQFGSVINAQIAKGYRCMYDLTIFMSKGLYFEYGEVEGSDRSGQSFFILPKIQSEITEQMGVKLKLAFGQVRWLHPVMFVSAHLADAYIAGEIQYLRDILFDTASLYRSLSVILDWFSLTGYSSVIRSFAKLYSGLRFSKVLGMQEVKAYYVAKIGDPTL